MILPLRYHMITKRKMNVADNILEVQDIVDLYNLHKNNNSVIIIITIWF